MRRLPALTGYRIRISPLDGLLFGLGFWIAWAVVMSAMDAVRGEMGVAAPDRFPRAVFQ